MDHLFCLSLFSVSKKNKRRDCIATKNNKWLLDRMIPMLITFTNTNFKFITNKGTLKLIVITKKWWSTFLKSKFDLAYHYVIRLNQ